MNRQPTTENLSADLPHLTLTMSLTSLPFGSTASQCPNCFSFNSPEYLPEKKKQFDAEGLLLTCATCGTSYRAPQPKAA